MSVQNGLDIVEGSFTGFCRIKDRFGCHVISESYLSDDAYIVVDFFDVIQHDAAFNIMSLFVN